MGTSTAYPTPRSRGVQWTDSTGTALRKPDGLPVSLRRGIRTVLFGDSMTDWFHFSASSPSASYDTATGVLTVNFGGAHELHSGCYARVWHPTYASMADQVYVPITVASSSLVTVQLSAGLSGVPNGALAAGLFFYADSSRAIASFVNWLQMLGGWPLNVVRNAAQSGDPVAGNVRRLARDIAAYSPDIVIGQSPGINDLRSGDNRSESQIIADLTTLYDGILATGALLVVGTITPVSATEADRAYRGNMMTVLRVNQWIRRYASGKPSMIVLDHYKHFVDPANTNGLALAARVRNDGIHPATKSAILLAKQALAALALPAGASSLPRTVLDCHPNSRLTVSSAVAASGVVTVTSTSHKYHVGDEFRALGGSDAAANGWFTVASVPTGNTFTYSAPGVADGSITGLLISRSRNLFANPILSTTSGGVVTTGGGNTLTGTAAGNLSVDVQSGTGLTAAASVAAAANVGAGSAGYALPLVGNEQVVDVSVAAAANVLAITTYGSTAFSSQMTGGRSYVFEAVLRLKSTDWSATWLSNLYGKFSVNCSVRGWISSTPLLGQDTSETQVIAEDMRLHIRSAVLRVPAGETVNSSDVTLRATIGAAFSGGPVLTMGLSQINVLDVTGDEDSWL